MHKARVLLIILLAATGVVLRYHYRGDIGEALIFTIVTYGAIAPALYMGRGAKKIEDEIEDGTK